MHEDRRPLKTNRELLGEIGLGVLLVGGAVAYRQA
jgi:hypothetical protein